MVHGAKKQSFNRIISGKPTDATRANALPFNVGAKKSGGFVNRLLSVAQPRPRRNSSQPSCEYFFIQDISSGAFLNTGESDDSIFNAGEGGPNYDIYKVRLLSAGGGLVYIQGKNGKYMTVLVRSSSEQIAFTGFENPELSEQRFKVTITNTDNIATIQTGGNRGGAAANNYLYEDTTDNKAKMRTDEASIKLIPARQFGNKSC